MQLPEPRDVWWEVGPKADLAVLAQEVAGVIAEYGIPALKAHAND